MHIHADKTRENKSRAGMTEASKKQAIREPVFQFVDNRPEAIAQRKLQGMASNSSQVSRLRSLQEMANNSPQAKQATQLKAMLKLNTTTPIQQEKGSETIQPDQAPEEGNLMRSKFEIVQYQGNESDSKPFENNTRLPDNLMTGIKSHSGMSLDNVKAHYNSAQADAVNALAYTQDTDIHFAPGQYQPESQHRQNLLGHGVVQRMFNGEDDGKEESIGERVGRRGAEARSFANMTKRQKALHRGFSSDKAHEKHRKAFVEKNKKAREKQRDLFRRGIWDGKTRPTFTDNTWTLMLKGAQQQKRADNVITYKCEDNAYYPRKNERAKDEAYVTLDHKIDWRRYILEHAKANDEGEITKDSAKEAYNDLKNLQLMSNVENSKKNAPKGVFD
jgi:hypothetical protein